MAPPRIDDDDDEYEHYENEEEELSSTDDDDDEGLNEDLAALARACMVATPAVVEEIPKEDPLLQPGDVLVPFSDSDDNNDDLDCLRRVHGLYGPLSTLTPSTSAFDDNEDEDDLETARSVLQRYSGNHQGGMGTLTEDDQAANLGCDGVSANGSFSHNSNTSESCPTSQCPNEATNSLTENIGMQYLEEVENFISDVRESPESPQKRQHCHPAMLLLVDAINKNRSFQRFLRSKATELESKIQESKKIREKFKLLSDFQVSCERKTGNALSLKKDPRVLLISAAKKPCETSNSKRSKKKISPMCYGPAENSQVANYKKALERFPVSLDRKKWSDVERENLSKGIKQQFQEMMLQNSVDRTSPECLSGDANDMDAIIASTKDLEITPEMIGKFLPKVDWDQLASMHLVGRTGSECQSRWLNCEDPLINHGPWTSKEDKSLLSLVQNLGMRNWFNIAASLGTNRTPFQCLARYQRSLNTSLLNSEWTEEEDAQLCAAVARYGENDWQSVASVLERRTGTQCSDRWRKCLCPMKKGRFSPEEDTRLTVAVKLFGHKWSEIAKYVPGRNSSQCRDRYLNSLDPSLKRGGWTEEEDARLEAAVIKHGYCWSKVAKDVPPRTDCQCRKRWKVLCPEHVPLLQEARKMRKSILPSHFADRESERPALTLNDFLPSNTLGSPSDGGALSLPLRRNRKSRNVRDVPVTECSDVPKKMRSRKRANKAPIAPEELEDVVCSGKVKVKTCHGGSDSEDLDNITLASFLHNRPNKGQFKCTRNVNQGSSSSVTTAVSKQVENRMPSGEQDGLSLSCDAGGTEHLLTLQNVGFQGQVSKPKDANTLIDDEDNITPACLMGKKSKKLGQAAKGRKCASPRLKIASVLLGEAHCANMPTITADGGGPSSLKLVEEEQSLHGLNLEGDDGLLASYLQDGLVPSCDAGGTEHLLMLQDVGFQGQAIPNDASTLTDDEDDKSLAFLLGKKSQKLGQAAKDRECASSKLENGSVLPGEVLCEKPTVMANGGEPSLLKLLDLDISFLHDLINFNSGDNDLLNSFLQDWLSLSCDSGGTEHQLMLQDVGLGEPTNMDVD